MDQKAITERQQYWLAHIEAADASEGALVDYAKMQSLRAKDLYYRKA